VSDANWRVVEIANAGGVIACGSGTNGLGGPLERGPAEERVRRPRCQVHLPIRRAVSNFVQRSKRSKTTIRYRSREFWHWQEVAWVRLDAGARRLQLHDSDRFNGVAIALLDEATSTRQHADVGDVLSTMASQPNSADREPVTQRAL